MSADAATHLGGARTTAQRWGWQHAGQQGWAVKDLDLDIEPGQRVLLLGPSGSGKSTVLHGLAGLLGGADEGHQSGRILVDGAPPAGRRDRIGMVLQDPDSQVILSRVGDDVAFGMENFAVPRSAIWPRVAAALRAVGLDLPVQQDTSTLSGGQKQRLALAGVLAMKPGLILLDEPTANLDAAGVLEVRDAVTAAADATGATVVVVEHRTGIWLPVVDRVIVLCPEGGIVADGPPAQTIARQREHLVRSGIWVPDDILPAIPRHRPAMGVPLLTASGLTVGYPSAAIRGGLDFGIDAGRVVLAQVLDRAGLAASGLEDDHAELVAADPLQEELPVGVAAVALQAAVPDIGVAEGGDGLGVAGLRGGLRGVGARATAPRDGGQNGQSGNSFVHVHPPRKLLRTSGSDRSSLPVPV